MFSIQEVSWLQAQNALRQIREQVFMHEQQVPPELEWDGLDATAVHLLALGRDMNPIGCARVLPGGAIGRMAVLKDWRGQGVGQAILKAAIYSCRSRGWLQISLSAQTHAIGFYERAGFTVCSEEYLDAGIPHKDMFLNLSA
ncbi:MAG TPA: GNAT family N-acetyltransferase [Methylophilaceae bacterium]|nr:GNAT family N-acetyltransferase [Methylophilaceae bacterium]